MLRYFPLRSHVNAERAARAVEAAAQQGELEAMYRKMYDTQAQWGERQIAADDVFRGFAEQLGLGMAAFDATYNDPATPNASSLTSPTEPPWACKEHRRSSSMANAFNLAAMTT